jgi:hypothetical protein
LRPSFRPSHAVYFVSVNTPVPWMIRGYQNVMVKFRPPTCRFFISRVYCMLLAPRPISKLYPNRKLPNAFFELVFPPEMVCRDNVRPRGHTMDDDRRLCASQTQKCHAFYYLCYDTRPHQVTVRDRPATTVIKVGGGVPRTGFSVIATVARLFRPHTPVVCGRRRRRRRRTTLSRDRNSTYDTRVG